jgi:hypothetical protein
MREFTLGELATARDVAREIIIAKSPAEYRLRNDASRVQITINDLAFGQQVIIRRPGRALFRAVRFVSS